jgi:small subunit ribosomal protein S20
LPEPALTLTRTVTISCGNWQHPFSLPFSCSINGATVHERLRLREIRAMANTKSAKIATRKIARRTEVNKSRRSRMRLHVRRVEEAIASGDASAAKTALREAQPEMMRAAQKSVVHKNQASRKVSRLAHRIAKLGK